VLAKELDQTGIYGVEEQPVEDLPLV
jgi:hypothetical protein